MLRRTLPPVGFCLAAAFACSETSVPNPIPQADGRPLGDDVPFTTEQVELDGLQGPVDVVRDTYGTIHIYATSVADALRVEGYQVGRDRTVQLELIRRFSEGRTAEMFGDVSPSLIDGDIEQRTIGLTRTAKAMYDALAPDSDEKLWLDAFADGVTQYYARVASGDEALPRAIVGFQPKFLTPWSGIDSLAISRYQSQNLSFDGSDDVDASEFAQKARAEFFAGHADPARQKRAGLLLDMWRFAPLAGATPLKGFPNDGLHVLGLEPSQTPPIVTPRVGAGLLASTKGWRAASHLGEMFFGDLETRGSNNWAVGAGKSATGHALVASDPHLSLSSPPVFWMVHLDVRAKPGGDASKDLNATGLAFPGIPGIILGANEHVAWGATTAGYDVTDVYREQLTPDGAKVVFKGQEVPLQKVRETIAIAGSAPLEYDVLVAAHHGPIIPNVANHKVLAPDPQQGALSYKWTGFEPTREMSFVRKMMYAKNVEDVRAAARDFEVGAQNWTAGDDAGNVFWTTQSRIPKRDPRATAWDAAKAEGTIPLMVLPGDGTCEWTGFVEEAYIPHQKNPQEGFLATANSDPIGNDADNDPTNDKLPSGEPGYLGSFDDGLRTSRIYERLRAGAGPLSPADMASIQADVKSPYGSRLGPVLSAMIDRAEQERMSPGTHPDLGAVVASARYAGANVLELRGWLAKWAQDSDSFAESGMSPDDNTPVPDAKEALASKATLLHAAWMVRMGSLVFDDEMQVLSGVAQPVRYQRTLLRLLTTPPAMLATFDPATGQSALFDDLGTANVTETRDERGLTALLDAVDMLTARLGGDRDKWRWGKLHALRHGALVSLWSQLSIPAPDDRVFPLGYPRHGDLSTVDVGNYGTRPGDYATIGFSYGSGPTQRFVADMAPGGPIITNALPGGNVWNNDSPHFKDDDELWRRNKTRRVWILRPDVVLDAKERITYRPKKA